MLYLLTLTQIFVQIGELKGSTKILEKKAEPTPFEHKEQKHVKKEKIYIDTMGNSTFEDMAFPIEMSTCWEGDLSNPCRQAYKYLRGIHSPPISKTPTIKAEKIPQFCLSGESGAGGRPHQPPQVYSGQA